MRGFTFRTGFFVVTLVGGVFSSSNAYVYAQSKQSTYGPCSPAIGNTRGNVTVSCITGNNRIRIAAFERTLTSRRAMDAFEEFIDKNDKKIVRIDVAFDQGDERLMFPEEKDDQIQLIISDADEKTCGGVTCGGLQYTIIVKREYRNEEMPIYLANGTYYVKGFFIPEPISGVHQGWLSTSLQYVPNEKILLSDKYITP